MIRVLERAESSLLSGFNYQFSELEKRYIEAKDNVIAGLKRRVAEAGAEGARLAQENAALKSGPSRRHAKAPRSSPIYERS